MNPETYKKVLKLLTVVLSNNTVKIATESMFRLTSTYT